MKRPAEAGRLRGTGRRVRPGAAWSSRIAHAQAASIRLGPAESGVSGADWRTTGARQQRALSARGPGIKPIELICQLARKFWWHIPGERDRSCRFSEGREV